MYFDFSICENPVPYSGITLNSIFYVDGDATYHIPKKTSSPGKTYFLYTVQGEGVLNFNEKTITATSGTFIYLQPEGEFSYHCKEDSWEFWWFEFTGPCSFPPNQLTPLLSDQLMMLLMARSLQYTKSGDWELSTALFQSLTLLVLRNANRTTRTINNEQVFSSIEMYIRKNLSTVTVSELSEAFNIEERTLRNLFARTVNISPKRFIMKIRLEYAANLLLTTAGSLNQIALQVGFSNRYHLSKAFKDYFGISPIQYRKYIESHHQI